MGASIWAPSVARLHGLAEHSIKKVEVLEFEELGMEAVWKIEVEDFPAFIVINHKGQDFYADLDAQRPLVQLGNQAKP